MNYPHPKDYKVNLVHSPEDESYVATFPEFPGLTGFGDEPKDALDDLYQVFEAAVEIHLEEGYPIPEPTPQTEVPMPSGEFRLRVPRITHYCLAEQARAEGVSQNTLAAVILQDGLTRRQLIGRGEQQYDSCHGVSINILALEPSARLVGSLTNQLEEQAFPDLNPRNWFKFGERGNHEALVVNAAASS